MSNKESEYFDDTICISFSYDATCTFSKEPIGRMEPHLELFNLYHLSKNGLKMMENTDDYGELNIMSKSSVVEECHSCKKETTVYELCSETYSSINQEMLCHDCIDFLVSICSNTFELIGDIYQYTDKSGFRIINDKREFYDCVEDRVIESERLVIFGCSDKGLHRMAIDYSNIIRLRDALQDMNGSDICNGVREEYTCEVCGEYTSSGVWLRRKHVEGFHLCDGCRYNIIESLNEYVQKNLSSIVSHDI